MVLETDTKFEKKLTCGLKNGMRNLENFPKAHKKFKIGPFIGPFIQSIKCMSLKLIGELYGMTMKNDVKYEKELNCQFKIDIQI